MRKTMLFLFVATFFMAGCATTGHIKTLDTKNSQAIVIGKITVLYNGEDVTAKSTILFNEIMWGKYAYRLDETGYMIMKLPLGKNYIARLGYKNFHQNLEKEYATFELSNTSRIHYIGDIVIKWTGKKDKTNAGSMFGLIGALIDESSSDGTIELSVQENVQAAEEQMKKQFNCDEKVETSWVVVGRR